MSKKQMGFTLIEIVMVLVLLGILSAIAVPKYFDLRDKAEEKAMAAVAAEYQARLNAGFAQALLENNACASARVAGLKVANGETTTTGEDGSTTTTYATDYGDYDIGEGIANSTTSATATLTLKRKTNGTGYSDLTKTFDIAIPQCN